MIKQTNRDIIFISNGKKGKESKIAERQRQRERERECERGKVAARGGSVS